MINHSGVDPNMIKLGVYPVPCMVSLVKPLSHHKQNYKSTCSGKINVPMQKLQAIQPIQEHLLVCFSFFTWYVILFLSQSFFPTEKLSMLTLPTYLPFPLDLHPEQTFPALLCPLACRPSPTHHLSQCLPRSQTPRRQRQGGTKTSRGNEQRSTSSDYLEVLLLQLHSITYKLKGHTVEPPIEVDKPLHKGQSKDTTK